MTMLYAGSYTCADEGGSDLQLDIAALNSSDVAASGLDAAAQALHWLLLHSMHKCRHAWPVCHPPSLPSGTWPV